MQQALDRVRQELGPDAMVLHTRELNNGLLQRMLRGREYEIAASAKEPVRTQQVNVREAHPLQAVESPRTEPVTNELSHRERYRRTLQEQSGNQLQELQFMSQQLRKRAASSPLHELSSGLFDIYTSLIESDIEEDLAHEMLNHLRSCERLDLHDVGAMQHELLRLVEGPIQVTGPLQVSTGEGRVVALVGPTGVGKTTTIAKLAANYRLRERKSVGLITVDTYRIAAVEQLRTYADIIDLPMEVVSTPREMREAVVRMKKLDLILMDTAGRSPKDQIRIQELKTMLAEADPAEVHLVLSAVGSARSLVNTVERFAPVGTTNLLVTKLDEATGLGNLLSLTRQVKMPVSYVTDGQNVPDDIRVATSRNLAEMILGLNSR